jgi:hypothetical protein
MPKVPKVDDPPLRVFWFSGPASSEGIEVVDCFRFRNKIGLDVAIDALNQAIKRRGTRPADLLRYARLCRIESIMLPYVQAIR